MAKVIGIRFKEAGKVYYFDPTDIWPRPGDEVVVETTRGIEFGEVVTGARTIDDAQVELPLKKVLRLATDEDKRRAEFNIQREKTAFHTCQEKILKHKLDMKLVSAEYTFDNSKIIFCFTASGRVDFRDLVKDLAALFKMRIELRQIGVRDEAKMCGGFGPCGRPICCDAFLGDFQPVSIKMAKEQNLSLNPTKISGQCGRLMCCLKYEQDNYDQVLKRLPKVGRDIVTPDGVGVLAEIDSIRERVKVRLKLPDESFGIKDFALDEVRIPGPGDGTAVRESVKPVEKSKPQEDAQKNDDAAEDKRRRISKQKAARDANTDQFLEKMGNAEKSEKSDKREKGKRLRRHPTEESENPVEEMVSEEIPQQETIAQDISTEESENGAEE